MAWTPRRTAATLAAALLAIGVIAIADRLVPARAWVLPHTAVYRGRCFPPEEPWLTVRYPPGWHAVTTDTLTLTDCADGERPPMDCDLLAIRDRGDFGTRLTDDTPPGVRDYMRVAGSLALRGVKSDVAGGRPRISRTTVVWIGPPLSDDLVPRTGLLSLEATWESQSANRRAAERTSRMMERILGSVRYVGDVTGRHRWSQTIVTQTVVVGLSEYAVRHPVGWTLTEDASGVTIAEYRWPWLDDLLGGLTVRFATRSARSESEPVQWQGDSCRGLQQLDMARGLVARRAAFIADRDATHRTEVDALVSIPSSRYGSREYWEDEQVAWRIVSSIGTRPDDRLETAPGGDGVGGRSP